MIKVLAVQVGILLLVLTGWVMNINKLANCDFEAPYRTEIIRVVGLIPPVGAVVGWMDIGEENEQQEEK